MTTTNTPTFIPGSIIPPKKKEPYRVQHIEDVHHPDYMTSTKLDFNGSGFLYRLATRAIERIEDKIPSTPFNYRIKELQQLHQYAVILIYAQKVLDTLDEDTYSGLSVAPNEIKPYLQDRKTKLTQLINQRKSLLVQLHPELYRDLLANIP